MLIGDVDLHMLRPGYGPETVQVLVTLWPDGSAEVAVREDQRDTWGPPHSLRNAP